METQGELIEQARLLCVKFIGKVDNGRARSTVTYNECKSLLTNINEYNTQINKDQVGKCLLCVYGSENVKKMCNQCNQ